MSKKELELNIDTLWDAIPDGKKLGNRVGVRLPLDLYNVICGGLINNSALPFSGSLEQFITYACAETADNLKNFLDSGHRSMLHGVRQMQKHLSAERWVITIEEQVNQQVDTLKVWTAVQEWPSVIYDLHTWAGMIDELPEKAWRARAARTWMTNRGVKELRNIWVGEMPGEEYRKVEKIFVHWEQLGRV